jgi:hypothetical protein
MPFEQLLALAILAVVGSFTPGPNNMIATVTGANHGFRAVLPHIVWSALWICEHANRRRYRRRGSFAGVSIYRSIDQVGRHYLSAFHCLAARAAECD